MKKLILIAFLGCLSQWAAADTLEPRTGATVIDIGSSNWGPKVNANTKIFGSSFAVQGQPNVFTSTNAFNDNLIANATFTVTHATVSINGVTYFWNAGLGGAGQFLSNVNGTITSAVPAGTGGGGGGSISAYGMIYTSSSNVTQTSISTTPVKLNVFQSVGPSLLAVSSATSALINVSTTVTCLLQANIISTGTGNFNQYFEIRVNGNSTGITCQDTPSARCQMVGIKALTAGDTVQVYTNVSVVGNSTITVTDAQLVVSAIGGTGTSGTNGSNGASTIAFGTGTASNFTTNVTSPTAAVSFLGSEFNSTTAGTTNFMTLNLASVTVQGNVFNGASQLAKLDSNSALSLSSLTVSNTKLFDAGFQVLPVVQVQYYHSETSSNTTNTAFVNTTVSGSFTPKFSTSKVLLFATGILSQNVGDGGYVTFGRNGTNLAPNNGGFMGTVSNTNYNLSMIYYDSPGTTSAVTYSIMFRTFAGGSTIVFPVTNGGVVPSAGLLAVELAQ